MVDVRHITGNIVIDDKSGNKGVAVLTKGENEPGGCNCYAKEDAGQNVPTADDASLFIQKPETHADSRNQYGSHRTFGENCQAKKNVCNRDFCDTRFFPC